MLTFISEIKILELYVLYMVPFALFATQIREFYGNTFFSVSMKTASTQAQHKLDFQKV